ncbi:MAG: hypothetical protein V1838_01205 [Patescibacteria group bacterium]
MKEQYIGDEQKDWQVPETNEPEPDMDYVRQITSFFRDEKEDQKDDPEYVAYLEKCRQELDTLGRQDPDDPLKAEDIRIGLGELGNRVTRDNEPKIRSALFITGDQDHNNKMNEKAQFTRKLFMDTGKKVYENVEVDVHQDDLDDVAKELGKIDPQFIKIFKGEVNLMVKDDSPDALSDGRKLLLRKIDLMESYANDNINRDTHSLFEEPDKEITIAEVDRKQELDILNKALYKLELMRNQLNLELYGKTDIQYLRK